jgi:hypothetical protein
VAAAVVLWLTDFLHHVPASKIALGVVLLALLPRVGVLGMEDLRRVDYLLVFFVARSSPQRKVWIFSLRFCLVGSRR